MKVRDKNIKQLVDVSDKECPKRECYWPRPDPGVFTQGVGYRTRYPGRKPDWLCGDRRGKHMRGFAAVGLHQPKDHLNVGEALRAAGCYGAAMLCASGLRYKRACTDTQAAHRHLPLLQVEDLRHALPYDCVPVAVDLIDGAIALPEYKHPERAFYIFGPEDGTLGPEITGWCRDVVYVPTRHCMNLAATVNVILYDRAAKSFKPHNRKW